MTERAPGKIVPIDRITDPAGSVPPTPPATESSLAPPPSRQDIHDRVADAYFGKLGAAFMRQTQRRVHWICERVQGTRVLDVGCSQGIVSILLAREGKVVVGLDSDPKSIVEAEALLKDSQEPPPGELAFVTGEFLSYAFEAERFDTVVMSEVLEHLVRPAEFVAKAAKLLVDDGTLVVTVPFGINDFFDHKRTYYLFEPLELLAKHFEIVEVTQLGDWIGFVGRRRRADETARPIEALERSLVEQLERGFFEIERRLRDELTSLSSRLNDANGKYRAATEKIQALSDRAASSDLASGRLEEELATATTDLAKSRKLRRRARRRVEQLRAELAELERTSSELRSDLDAANTARDEHERALEALRERLTAAQSEARQAETNRARLESELAIARTSSEKVLVTARAEGDRLRSELAALTAQHEAQRAEMERLKVEALRSRIAANEARMQVDHARHETLAARRQVEKERNTLSFQLGHSLIFGLKSWSGVKTLPRRLLEIREEARRRREHARPARQPVGATRASIERASLDVAALRPVSRPAPRLELASEARDFARTLKALRVASIMDGFTEASFASECQLRQLTPQDWATELEGFRPELLFIESAWRGKNDLWGSKVGHTSQELQGVVRWCRERGVPTVFWNKEDPVHFETFLSTAKLFDYVFTTDIDCIQRYKAALGHEHVYLLPFACQPRVNNPIETYDRKDAFCFAGAYYVRYPERTRDLGNFVASLPDFRPVEIYDRNFGKTDPNYQFPPEYQPFIVGNLPFDQIDRAYKGYRFAINLNSIKESQSMFARRVYELLGSNTVTVSNYSRGLRLMFGDLVVTSDSGVEVMRRLRELCGDEASAAKLRLAALRKAMAEHTYQDRLAYVVSKVRGEEAGSLLPRFVVVGYARDDEQADAIFASFQRQSFARRALVLVLPGGFVPARVAASDDVQLIAAPEAEQQGLRDLGTDEDWLAAMVSDDYYGPNYLLDLALATRYAPGPVVGKRAFHSCGPEGRVELVDASLAYRPVDFVSARSGAARLDTLDANLREWVRSLYTARFDSVQALSLDPFNYCRAKSRAAVGPAQIAVVDDAPGLDVGLPLAELLERAERIGPAEHDEDHTPKLRGADLGNLCRKAPPGSCAHLSVVGDELQIVSTLDDGKHEYWWANRDHRPGELGATNGRIKLHLDLTPGLNVQIVLRFLDAQGSVLSSAIKPACRNHEVEIPAGTERIRLGLRIYASGSARLLGLLLGHRDLEPAELLGRSEHLIVTNHYPSADDLYRNGFVHRRVVAYRDRGTRVDVFRLRPNQAVSYHEFENVDCITGSAGALDRLLASGRYRTVLVHFLDEAMWSVLSRYVDRVKVVVWVHGAEIQPLHRREYSYTTNEQRAAAKVRSDARMAFWRGLLRPMPPNLRLVFVSRHFAEEVMEDLGFRLPEGSYEIIHNPIDTELFAYRPKPVEQRKKILSIRPYASAIYANDLSVRAILQLANVQFFSDLEIRIIGDGPLFEETVAPLRDLPNVMIERRFLPQGEIARLHREYGVFLCPSRMDTQGVSRDEAMSSGLVPVTNSVAAIPEFVDQSCGILAPAEDAIAMAAGIARLVQYEELFARMSAAAAERVRRQSSVALTVTKELALLSSTAAQDA